MEDEVQLGIAVSVICVLLISWLVYRIKKQKDTKKTEAVFLFIIWLIVNAPIFAFVAEYAEDYNKSRSSGDLLNLLLITLIPLVIIPVLILLNFESALKIVNFGGTVNDKNPLYRIFSSKDFKSWTIDDAGELKLDNWSYYVKFALISPFVIPMIIFRLILPHPGGVSKDVFGEAFTQRRTDFNTAGSYNIFNGILCYNNWKPGIKESWYNERRSFFLSILFVLVFYIIPFFVYLLHPERVKLNDKLTSENRDDLFESVSFREKYEQILYIVLAVVTVFWTISLASITPNEGGKECGEDNLKQETGESSGDFAKREADHESARKGKDLGFFKNLTSGRKTIIPKRSEVGQITTI